MKKRWRWIAAIVVIFVALILIRNLGKSKAVIPDTIVQTVKTQMAATMEKEDVIIGTGNVEAIEKADISSKVNGKVNQVMVVNGKQVTKGDTLIILDNGEQTNNLLTMQSNLNKDQISLQDKQKNYERYQALYNDGAISLQDLEQSKMQFETCQADVQVSRAAVANAQEALGNTRITTPITGLVANTNVSPGQVVSPGISLMTVQDISAVYILVKIRQEDISLIKQGMNTEITVDAYPERTFRGNVEIINPVVDQSARMLEVKIKVDNPDAALKPGMFAKVSLRTGIKSNVVAVPQEALAGKEGEYYVYVLEGNRAKRQVVEIGQTLDRNIEIKSGLSQGQQVIVTNVNKLKDQDLISIAND